MGVNGVRATDTDSYVVGALCVEEHATSMTKNFFTHPVTRELRHRFFFFVREPEIRVVATKFFLQSGFWPRTNYVEFG